jgi:hypothetical protein
MKFVLYVSEALVGPDSPEETDIFLSAVLKNARLGITGHLHREGPWFVQYLEGQDEAVDDLMGVIRADTRHRGLEVRGSHRIHKRRFADWSMILTPRARTSFARWAKLSGVPESLEHAPAARIIAFFRFVDRERFARADPLRP